MVVTSDCVLAGDAATNLGTVTGGKDNLLFLETSVSTGPLVAGDVFTNSGDCTGGADTFVVRDGRLRNLAGDVFDQQSGILRSGADRIIFVRGGAIWTSGDAGTISGGTVFAGADFITGSDANDVIYGEYRSMTGGTLLINATYTGADRLSGGAGNDTLNGQIGNDVLNGGLGNDTLTGGSNINTFRFDTAPNDVTNMDTITDFLAVDDRIQLENGVFTGLGPATGVLLAGLFNTGDAASQAGDRIIYNTVTGVLIYDEDGVGGTAGVQFALHGAGRLADSGGHGGENG